MRFIVPVALLLIAGSAEASFRESAPRSMHLIASPTEPGSAPKRLLLAQANPDMSAPPLVTAPEATPSASASPSPEVQQEAPLEIPVDPYAGTFVGKEVLAGAGMLFGFDLLAGGALFGVIAVAASANDWSGLGVAVLGTLAVGLLELAVAPLVAALGVYFAAPKQGNNGAMGAILGAYAGQLIATGIGIVGYVAYAGIAAAAGNSSAFYNGGGAVLGLGLFLVYAALHYVGLPIVSSLGVHWSGAINRSRADEDRVARVAITPDDFYVQAAGPRASPLVAIRF